ncbi:MAG: hypothetical protein A3J18_02565 [Candidatus Levybacteria bacterium RIFCSPLOWO2_02_FULL_40_18]|nr:MAG: hypothetical protein US02_C0001G0040 [Candidatus Levybacteria bacterium GW2011_GWA2_36_13]KKQ00983.1 MAG: hypothetical protein US07_C0003G0021 [Candidatus Levybacteria bacterium GW2011_GWB1_36_18]KKR17644.1 MAG: hypothetical protein UT44_C0005G0023 [Candidatus Levybacteria bacterium GW2011_GWA1_39_32]KKR73700.1 MAG: hypothetical protein UU15_C0004G0012 [Candidatus Levybacteria bacterium GW2011_GWC2_40_7]OGH20435.1 MAG: hypothetical protein A2695_01915 [Candidatus Levybacteria bacterium 
MKKYVGIFPYNDHRYLLNAAFNKNLNGLETPIFVTLKKSLKQVNIEVNTYDIVTKEELYTYVYFDLPNLWNIKAWVKIISNKNKNILICNEPPIVIPFNYWKIFHTFFTKVYTWNDSLVDNKKYFKILLPKTSLGLNIKPKKFKERKFLVLINKNILPFYPFKIILKFGKELYTERIRAIEFFEKTIPKKFYLYGRDWNKPKKHNLTERIIGPKKYLTYKGEVDDKIELLSSFKYSICFENLTDTTGFITEKIFDCLKARCVPVYWGATDIENYIPRECFIDFRQFKDYDELLKFLNSISEQKYAKYIKSIEKLLSDKKFINLWFEEAFADFFIKDILEIKK